jgi:putative transposase
VSAIEDLDKSFKAFWAGRKAGRRVGLPRFKARDKCRDSFRLRGQIHVERERVKLPVLGWLRIKGSASRFLADKICYATVSREANGWFVSITVEQERAEPLAPTGAPIGLDLGITHFATLSDGTVIDAPKPLENALRKLRREQKALSRSQRASAGRKRRIVRLARTHARVRAIRSDFLHRTSRTLATTHVAIGVESLNVAGMVRNHRLSRAISDLGWSEFLRQLAYKTQWSGSTLVAADRFYPSTKMCSGCGALVDMPLSQRIYRCSVCGLVLDRDLNSARNLCPVAVTPTDTLNASGGNVSPGSAWQIPVKLELSTQALAA